MSSRIYQELELPVEIGDGRLDTLIRVFALLGRPQQRLRLNWTKVTDITPAGHALLACLFDRVIEQGCRLENIFLKKAIKTLPVVSNLMEVKQYQTLPSPSIHDYTEAHLIFKGCGPSIDVSFFEQVRNQFKNQLSDDLLFACQLIHNELMQNSVDHAAAERYYCYAGIVGAWFHLGVLDMGVTIPAKLAQKYNYENDVEAINEALKLGISTRRQRTGGLGLSHTFELLKQNEGRLSIVSRQAQLRRYFKGRKIAKSPLKHTVNGTWCFTRFRLGGE